MQIAPSAQLSHIVKHYLLLTGEKGANLNYRLFSDGNPGLVFHLHDPLIKFRENGLAGELQPRSFIYGQITGYNNVATSGKLGMVVVVLQPYGVYMLSGLAAYELNDATVQLTDVFGRDAAELEEQILSLQTTDSIISNIERFLLEKCTSTTKPDRIIFEALKLINNWKGNVTVAQLLGTLPVTERQLERKFNEWIGITPKKFSGIVRLHHFLKILQRKPASDPLSATVYDCGYYDQAHFNHFFKKSTGITPSAYKASENLLAINFMPV